MSVEMDRNLIEFLGHIDASLAAVEAAEKGAQRDGPSWLVANYQQLARNLQTLRQTAASGKLPRPSRDDVAYGAGLALGKSIGEWCDNDGIMKAMSDIEDYYRYKL